jgi:RNA polymerase sigma-70 factor (ECF subfamily)
LNPENKLIEQCSEKVQFPAAEETDEILLKRFSKGDEEAFYSIVRRYERPIIRYVCGLASNNTELGRDVCQETFLQLINRPPSFLFGGKLKPWLFRVARNKMYDAFRKEKQELTGEDIKMCLHQETKDREDNLFADEQLARLNNAMTKIPEKYRELISMHYYGNLTFNEISRVMRIPIGTAIWRMQKAISLLRNEIKGISDENIRM